MDTWKDSALTEASGLAYSRKLKDIAYTHNDENGRIFVVNLSTGETVGRVGIADRTLVDPEDADMDFDGNLWIADIGDNDPSSRSSIAAYKHSEPGLGYPGDIEWVRYVYQYPGGAKYNAETFINKPDGKQYIITKASSGRVFQVPVGAQPGQTNTLKLVHGPDADLAYVAGGVSSADGLWNFCVFKDELTTIFILDKNWNLLPDTIPMPSMTKPEGIGIQRDGKYLIVCDDKGGAGGKYQKVKVPKDYWPVSVPTTPPPPTPPPVNPCMA